MESINMMKGTNYKQPLCFNRVLRHLENHLRNFQPKTLINLVIFVAKPQPSKKNVGCKEAREDLETQHMMKEKSALLNVAHFAKSFIQWSYDKPSHRDGVHSKTLCQCVQGKKKMIARKITQGNLESHKPQKENLENTAMTVNQMLHRKKDTQVTITISL